MRPIDLKKKVEAELKPLNQIPPKVLAMRVTQLLTERRLVNAGASGSQATKMYNSLAATSGIRNPSGTVEGLIEMGLHSVPSVGEKGMTQIIAIINAATAG